MNDHSAAAAGQAELPRSAYLDHTLRRAWNAAQARSHRYVTLEHLLLALLDDPDAAELLQAVEADIPTIQTSVATSLNNNGALVTPNGTPPAFSYKFDNLFAGAFKEVTRAGRQEIDGAFLLVAIARHPDTDAAAILSGNGFNPQVAQRTLDMALGVASPEPAAQPKAPPPPRPRDGRGPGPKPSGQHTVAPHPSATGSRAASSQSGSGAGDRFMEDMLASVRSILDAENRKDWALAPLLNPAATQGGTAPQRQQARPETAASAQPAPLPPLGLQAPPPLQPAPAPQPHAPSPPPPGPAQARPAMPPAPAPRPHAPVPPPPGQAQPHPPASAAARPLPPGQHQAPPPPAPRIEPQLSRPGAAPQNLQAPPPSPQPGFAEPAAPAFDLELSAQAPASAPDKPQQKQQKKRRPAAAPNDRRAQKAPLADLGQLLETIPRRLRLGAGEIVEIKLGREETETLFPRQPQAGEGVRAVTLRLTAPEGGFFVETLAPETQWLAGRPDPAGEEPFGTWSWAVVPNETGTQTLAVSAQVRDVHANGELAAARNAGQAIEIRVRGGGMGRKLLGLFRSLVLLAVGAGMAAAAWYVLKATGHSPL
jgi:hypothetical protein